MTLSKKASRLPEMPSTESPLVIRRGRKLKLECERYAWWLSADSKPLRASIDKLGWRLSRQMLRLLGRPQGALTWPLGLGLLPLNANTPSSEYIFWVGSLFSGIMDKQGRWRIPFRHIDMGGIAYAALRMHELTGESRYYALASQFGEAILMMPGAQDGTIPYNCKNANVLVDTLAFICPFLARFSQRKGDAVYADLAVKQLDAMWLHGRAMSPWIQHGFDRDNLQELGSCHWGRGLGWLILGLVDTLVELPDSEAQHHLFTKTTCLLDKLASAQLIGGHFPLMLDNIDITPDSSLTAIVAYSLARLKQAEFIKDIRYDVVLSHCRSALDASTQSDGRVFDCSGEAGGSAEYSSSLGYYLWAQGPTVACDELLGGNG